MKRKWTMFNNFMKDWDEITDLKKLVESLKKDITKFKEKFYKNLRKLF